MWSLETFSWPQSVQTWWCLDSSRRKTRGLEGAHIFYIHRHLCFMPLCSICFIATAAGGNSDQSIISSHCFCNDSKLCSRVICSCLPYSDWLAYIGLGALVLWLSSNQKLTYPFFLLKQPKTKRTNNSGKNWRCTSSVLNGNSHKRGEQASL